MLEGNGRGETPASQGAAGFDTSDAPADPAVLARDLRDLIARDRRRAIEALVEYDDLELQRNPETEADYALKVGRQRDACLRSELAMLRARRMLHLARSARAEGLALGRDTLALVVADEFAAVTRQADARLSRYMALIDMRQRAVAASPEEADEFREIYRRFVVWLHPSLHPVVDEPGRRLLADARAAYADGDLDRLRALAARLPVGMPPDEPAELSFVPREPGPASGVADPAGLDAASLDELAAEHNMLDALAGVLGERVAELGRSYPAKYRACLANPNWVARQVFRMSAWIERCDALTLRYRHELRELLLSNEDGPKEGR